MIGTNQNDQKTEQRDWKYTQVTEKPSLFQNVRTEFGGIFVKPREGTPFKQEENPGSHQRRGRATLTIQKLNILHTKKNPLAKSKSR